MWKLRKKPRSDEGGESGFQAGARREQALDAGEDPHVISVRVATELPGKHTILHTCVAAVISVVVLWKLRNKAAQIR